MYLENPVQTWHEFVMKSCTQVRASLWLNVHSSQFDSHTCCACFNSLHHISKKWPLFQNLCIYFLIGLDNGPERKKYMFHMVALKKKIIYALHNGFES